LARERGCGRWELIMVNFKSKRSAAAVAALAAVALAACAPATAPQPGSIPSNYAPYDAVTNPFCGALGNCEPLIKEPYPIPRNWAN
jgi:hypothetical protein